MTNSPNTQPIFIRQPTIHSVVLSTELGETLPTSTLVPKTFIVGADPATAIETIEVLNTGVSVSTTLNLYLYSVSGTQGQSMLISQTPIPAAVAGTQIPIVVRLPKTLSPASCVPANPNQMLKIPIGWELRAALTNPITSPIILTAFGGNYY